MPDRRACDSGIMDYLTEYREQGFTVVRGVFGDQDIATMAAEFDRMHARGMQYQATFRHQNILYLLQQEPSAGPHLRFMQWPSYISPVLQDYRTDSRMLEILQPLLGSDIKQIINTLVWKQPGAGRTSYAYHQDHRFRRPASAYRHLLTSFVQTATAIDPHSVANGCLRMFRGSHLQGDLQLATDRSVYEADCDLVPACAQGLEERDLACIELEPGDVALWTPYTVHGSGNNTSSGNRRTYLNGYVRAADCDRGEWAFRDARPCALDEPVLVQYEDLYKRPEPHYVNGPPHPFRG